MADINATDLTPETAATLDGSEEFVMFDNVEGKRGELDTVGDYIVQHCDADGNGNTAAQLAGGAQTDASSALSKIGNLSSLDTTDKTDLVGAVNEVKGQADDNTTALQTKAEVDGAYEAMTVGNAEQLVSNIRVTDTDPYLFRTAGGSLEIGDREYPTLVGGSVAVNEWMDNQQFTSMTHWAVGPNATSSITGNVLTAVKSGSTPAGNQFVNYTGPYKIPKNHVVLIVANLASHSPSVTVQAIQASPWTGLGQQIVDVTTTLTQKFVLLKPTAGDMSNLIFNFDNKEDVSIQNPYVIDLTQYFGSSTIADHIYSLEQGTAGAGVAFCKKYGIGVGYTAYNAGTLQSTTPTKHKTVRFNQWDGQYNDNKLLNSTTGELAPGTGYYTSDYVKVVPNQAYYFNVDVMLVNSSQQGMAWYDADKNYISGIPFNNNFRVLDGKIATAPSNAGYVRWCGSKTVMAQECINLHWDGERDGEYEPYIKHEYDLGNDTLRGVFELNNGELKANGDVKTPDGTIQRKYGVLNLGSIEWTAAMTGGTQVAAWVRSYNVYSNIKPCNIATVANIVNSKYTANTANNVYLGANKCCAVDGNGYITVYDTDMTGYTYEQVRSALNGVYLVYELATPTEEEGTAFQSPQIVSNWGTEEYTEANGIVVGHSTEYPQDLKAKVESAPNNPSADGDYIVKRENGENAYVPLVIPQELPNAPSADGTYRLKCTVSGGAATYSWEA